MVKISRTCALVISVWWNKLGDNQRKDVELTRYVVSVDCTGA